MQISLYTNVLTISEGRSSDDVYGHCWFQKEFRFKCLDDKEIE